MKAKTKLHEDERGAVYVEFLIAFMPVFVLFLCLLQLSLLFAVKLGVEHAAIVAARSAAVVIGDREKDNGNTPKNKLSPAREAKVRAAVLLTLAPMIMDGSIEDVDIDYPAANDNSPGGKDVLKGKAVPPMTLTSVRMIRTRVTTRVKCKVGLANRIACGNSLFSFLGHYTTTMRATALYPYMGASYDYR